MGLHCPNLLTCAPLQRPLGGSLCFSHLTGALHMIAHIIARVFFKKFLTLANCFKNIIQILYCGLQGNTYLCFCLSYGCIFFPILTPCLPPAILLTCLLHNNLLTYELSVSFLKLCLSPPAAPPPPACIFTWQALSYHLLTWLS